MRRRGRLHDRASSDSDLPRLAAAADAPPSELHPGPIFEDARERSFGSEPGELSAGGRLWRLSVHLAKKRYAFVVGLVVGAAVVLYTSRQQVVYITQPIFASVVDELRTRMPGALLTNSFVEQLQLLPDLRVPTLFGGGEGVPTAAEQREAFTRERPGKLALRSNLSAKHPVIIIPGIVSTGLEMWAGHACASSYFRQRLWGTLSMIKLFMLDRDCWMRHMALNAVDGSDPPGIKVRPAQGFEAADYVVGGYWVWALLIENLADIGYSPSNMWVGAYDWRLPYHLLEERDQFFSRLRYHVEMFTAVHRTKVRAARLQRRRVKPHPTHPSRSPPLLSAPQVVVLTHSMGSTVWTYFQNWLSSPEGGKLSAAWVHEHIEAVVLIAPSALGTPKAVTGLLMGESRDFTYLTGTLGALVDSVLSARLRRRMMRAFPSTQTLMPMGGDAVWGDETGAPDDPTDIGPEADGVLGASREPTYGALLSQRGARGSADGADGSGELPLELVMTATQAMARIRADAERSVRPERNGSGSVPFAYRYEHGLSDPAELLRPRERAWINPLAAPLPYAPDLTIHCLYGVGVPTERAYVVASAAGAARADAGAEGGGESWRADAGAAVGTDVGAAAGAGEALVAAAPATGLATESGRGGGGGDDGGDEADGGGGAAAADEVPFLIDRSANQGAQLVKGVRLSNGDGTVPLVSLGYMCARGWREPPERSRLYNPSASRVVTREYKHEQAAAGPVPMRGERSADHVDILGNHGVIADILQIAAGKGSELSDVFESDILRISERVERRIARAHKRLAAVHSSIGNGAQAAGALAPAASIAAAVVRADGTAAPAAAGAAGGAAPLLGG